jgi:hypothetical protein
MTMYVEAVVVCVNYADFLAHTLPASKGLFNNMVVVTDLGDADTARVCNKYNVRCIQTNAFYANGEGFNKGAGINEGLKALNLKGWVVQMDADIYLPPLTRHIMDRLPLQQNKIYGIDRLMCQSYDDWMFYREDWPSVHELWTFAHLNAFPAGSRIVQYGDYLEDGVPPDGWVPIGFFQLWHPGASGIRSYPDQHAAADRTDVLHAKKFDRTHRELIPELVAIHLESAKVDMGENWNGRRTPRFAYQPLSQRSAAQQRRQGWVSRLWLAWRRFANLLRRLLWKPRYFRH